MPPYMLIISKDQIFGCNVRDLAKIAIKVLGAFMSDELHYHPCKDLPQPTLCGKPLLGTV